MQKIPNDLEEINRRISSLKEKKEQKKVKNDNIEVSNVFMGLRLGVEIASGTIVGATMGYMLDEIFDFKFILLLTLTIMGFFAGMLNAYRYVKQLDEDTEKKGE